MIPLLGGAMTSAWMVNWGLRRNLQSAYGRPLLLESALLLLFGLFGSGINFFIGGLVGAIGFKHIGYIATVPLAVLLLVWHPVLNDAKH